MKINNLSLFSTLSYKPCNLKVNNQTFKGDYNASQHPYWCSCDECYGRLKAKYGNTYGKPLSISPFYNGRGIYTESYFDTKTTDDLREKYPLPSCFKKGTMGEDFFYEQLAARIMGSPNEDPDEIYNSFADKILNQLG